MKDEKSSQKSSGKENEPIVENGKKKGKEEKLPTKVVIRRLPPTMTEEQFKEQTSPLPDFDYFYFVSADMSLSPNAFCRAYINFLDQNDLFIFTQKFDGYVFVDSKGGEFPAVVEFAPFQRIPKNRPNRKKDPKIGTIEADPIYIAFKEQLEAEILEKKASANVSKQHFFETSLIPEKKEANNTPLLDYIKNRKAERQRIKDEKREEKRKKDLERRRAKEEQKRTKKEDEISVVKTSPVSPLTEISNIDVHDEKPKFSEKTLTKVHDEKPKFSEKTLTKISLSTKVSEDKVIGLTNCKESNSSPYIKKEKPKLVQKVQDLVDYFNQKYSVPEPNTSTGFNPVPVVTRDGKLFFPQSTVISSACPVPSMGAMVFSSTRFGTYPKSHMYQSNAPKNITRNNTMLRNIDSTTKQNKQFESKFISTRQNNEVGYFVPNQSSEIKRSSRTVLLQNENATKTSFSSEVFSKNLKKVVEDVLGNSNIKPFNNCVIDKPKTFVRRIGSGDQGKESGFSTVNYFLPPRTFGFGPTVPMESRLKKEPHINSKPSHYQNTFNSSSIKGNSGTFSKNQLPPFSKKSVVCSKSVGDIETNDSARKIGGSEESFRQKSNYSTFQTKPRPYVAFKRFCVTDKNK